MISRVLAADLPSHVGAQVRVAGWLHRKRQLKSLTFLVIRDRSGLAQVVLASPEEVGAAAALPEETVVAVTGTVATSDQAPDGAEIVRPVITPLSGPAQPPPFDLYRPAVTATLPTILDHSPASLRHPRLRAPFEISAAAVAGFRAALDGLGFVEISTPKIVESATESGANVFGIDYFGQAAYLAQSPQFFKQAMVGVFERVYETAPAFRAEPHDTARHLAEYLSLDAELGFICDHHDVMAVLRQVTAGMVSAIAERAGAAVELLGVTLPEVPAQIPRSTSLRRRSFWPGTPTRTRAVSPTWPRPTSAGCRTGRPASMARSSSTSPGIRWPSGRSTPIRNRDGRATPTASTCSSAGWRSSPAASACTGTPTTWRHSPSAARTPGHTRPTWLFSRLACPRTAASRWGWSAGPRGSPARITSAASPSSPATCTA